MTLTPEQIEAILADIATGMPMTEACERNGTSYKHGLWPYRAANPDFVARLNEAREAGTEMLLDMAQQASMDLVTNRIGADGLPRVRDFKAARVGIDGLLRTAGKLNPNKFGDRLNLDVRHNLNLPAIMLAADARVAALEARRRPALDVSDAEVIDDRAAFAALLGEPVE